MKNKRNLELAQFVLEKGTNFCGADFTKIDSATFFIDNIKQKLGIFEKEIKEFIDLLERLRIVDKVSYVSAYAINPEMTGFAFECEMDIPKMKEFIKRGAGESTIFDQIKSQIILGHKELHIPRNTNQFYFCKIMYEHPINEWVEWDEIYEEMQGDLETGTWKKVYDVMIEVNKKAKLELNINEFFKYENHQFLRTI
jgi:hypothetical protein